MANQSFLGSIAGVIITGLVLILAGTQTDTFLSGVLILIGLAVWIGGIIVIIKKLS